VGVQVIDVVTVASSIMPADSFTENDAPGAGRISSTVMRCWLWQWERKWCTQLRHNQVTPDMYRLQWGRSETRLWPLVLHGCVCVCQNPMVHCNGLDCTRVPYCISTGLQTHRGSEEYPGSVPMKSVVKVEPGDM
jgi:hypothetical protein